MGKGTRSMRFYNTHKRICLFLSVLLALLFALSGCARAEESRIVIGYQYGVAYAPLLLMKERDVLEDAFPGHRIEWRQMNGPTPIREGMLNGEITFGFMGISPVLIGIDHGMPWKYMTGLSANRVAVVTNRADLSSLRDLDSSERIAILSPGCTQHILLSLLAKEQLGDIHALDTQLISMSHPDAMNALLSGTEVTIHVATSPYIEEELKQGMHVIAEGDEIMGEAFTFISGVAMTDFVAAHPEIYTTFLDCLQEAVDEINTGNASVYEELSAIYGIPAADLKEQMTYNSTIYNTDLNGIAAMSHAMEKTGFLSKALPLEDVVFEDRLGRAR